MYAYDRGMETPGTVARMFGANLRRIRKSLKLTQEGMETATGRSQSSISALERGENLSQLDELESEIRKAGGDPMELLRGQPSGLTAEQAEVLHLWSVVDDPILKGGLLQMLRAKAQIPKSAHGIE